jgi:DNA end-binding protein Ku
MALRSSWDGFLKLSLISVPVRAYNAAVPGGGDIHFNQIHKECGNRIRYQKVCPVHGEVTKDDIVSGYEYEKGKYVEVEREDLNKLRAEDDESINIDVFTAPDEVDPIYLSGKTFYLVPTGPAGQKPYALLHQVMKDKKRYAVGTVVLSGHDETVLIRPLDKLLTMTVMYYDEQVKNPSAFEDELGDAKVTAQEVKLAATLVEASTAEKFDISQYKDHYTERITKFLEAKLDGKTLDAPRHDKALPVINLMDALRKSLDQAQGGREKRQRASSAHRPERTHGRRKTG